MVVANAVVTIGTTLPPGKMRPPSAGGEGRSYLDGRSITGDGFEGIPKIPIPLT